MPLFVKVLKEVQYGNRNKNKYVNDRTGFDENKKQYKFPPIFNKQKSIKSNKNNNIKNTSAKEGYYF